MVSAAGRFVYRGRIDDGYVEFGRPRAAATRHDLRDALEAAPTGDPLTLITTEAIGGPIPPPR